MPNCPHCNAEVDVGQRICAWCGEEVAAPPKSKSPAPSAPRAPVPPPPASPRPHATSSSAGRGPSADDARELAKRGDLDGALRLYREILSNDPNDLEALFGTGGIHFKNGDHKKAVEVWLKLKVLNPSYPNLDQWIANAKKHLTPSSSAVTSPPTSAPPPPRPKAPTPFPTAPSATEDWQQQSVRVDRIDEAVLREPAPSTISKKEKSKNGVIRSEEEPLENAPPEWVAKMGWGLIVLYAIIIWGVYYY